MIPLYTSRQVREADHYAINTLGIPGALLMENASLELLHISRSFFQGDFNKVAFVSGKGNNGGDGFAAARHFANAGYPVTVIALAKKEDLQGDAKLNFEILLNVAESLPNIRVIEFKGLKDLKHLNDSDLIFDAMLGSGAVGLLKDPYKGVVEHLNKIKCKKVAVDIPTGLNADSGYGEVVFQADLTVTLGELKRGLFIEKGYENCGTVLKGYIGISESLFDEFELDEYLIEPEDVFDILPAKKKGGHKYSGGKVFIIAGSAEYPGAAVLTSNAVIKTGSGAPVLAFPKAYRKLLSKKFPEVVTLPYGAKKDDSLTADNLIELNEKISWGDLVICGPGLGRNEQTVEAVTNLINERKYKSLLLDADGIFPLNGKYKNFNLKEVVLTPHHAEFASLLGIPVDQLKTDLLNYGKEFVKSTGAYLVLKGAPTIIFLPEGDVIINTSGNAGMAKFGTGDVLTGVIASFIAQCKDIEKGILCGVYLHSLTADMLLKKYTEYSYSASDIIKHFPEAIKFLRKAID